LVGFLTGSVFALNLRYAALRFRCLTFQRDDGCGLISEQRKKEGEKNKGRKSAYFGQSFDLEFSQGQDRVMSYAVS